MINEIIKVLLALVAEFIITSIIEYIIMIPSEVEEEFNLSLTESNKDIIIKK